jgi:hypothetical protein
MRQFPGFTMPLGTSAGALDIGKWAVYH